MSAFPQVSQPSPRPPAGRRHRPFAAALCALAVALAVAVPSAQAAPKKDIGPKSGGDVATVALVLKVRNADGLVQFIDDVTDPTSASYRQFLSAPDFIARYSPTTADVAAVTGALKAAGISVTNVSDNRMVVQAQGTVAALNRYFGTDIHNFVSGAQRFHSPVKTPVLPASLSGAVAAVAGMSTEAVFKSRLVRNPEAGPAMAATMSTDAAAKKPATAPGEYTTFDVARFYQVQPLWDKGYDGKGRTVGIATLASFDPADAYAYWQGIGLKTKPNRIKQVHVNGGAGPDGADETTLDVQQSGGLAPMADIIVYDAPNTDLDFVALFAKAVTDNKVDTLSVSWGEPEIFPDPSIIAAMDQIFAQAAAQGISVFAATGDAGGYDFNDPSCKNVLTVDHPAVSPYITGAGGLTLPGVQTHRYPTPVVNVKDIRPWGWDYLTDYFNANYAALGGYLGVGFPVGGGGGVSVNEPMPKYQKGTPGIQKSAPGQSVICDFGGGFVDYLDLPARQPGRNLPDISLNADPYTGYLVYFAGAWEAGWGGTSFSSPQLNGITSVMSQAVGSRLGLLNPALYRLARNKGAYGPNGAFNDITKEDNIGWKAGPGYDAASGLGSINAANLADALAHDDGKPH